MRIVALLVSTIVFAQIAEGAKIYDASLKNGNYGGGFQVGTYPPGFNTSGSVGGNLANLGIVDSPTGVTFTTRNDVNNYSLGADGKNRI